MGGRVETLNVQTLKRSNVSKGFSLIEAIAALTIFGMAIVVAAGFLDVQMSAARRLEARSDLVPRSDLVRAAETVLESVRGGTLPLVTGEVDLTDEFLPLSTIRVRTRVGVTSRSPQGLYTVRVEARAMVRTEDMVVTITTQVWRP
jgi:prepilin-type N-terminal cleavage/methylation domain-containing protein